MNISNELRVGIMFFTGLALLVLLIVTLTRWGQDRNAYSFTIRFQSAQGIAEGSDVRLSGVKIGQISSVTIDPKTQKALIVVHVNRNIDLYKGYTYTVGTGGLVGQHYIEIMPATPPGARIASGDVVDGETSGDMNTLITSANTLVTKLGTTADALNSVLANPATEQNLRDAAANLDKTTIESTKLTTELADMVQRNEHKIDDMVSDLQDVAGGLRTVSAQLVHSHFLGNLETASANTVKLTDKLNHVSDAIDTLVTDPELKNTLHQTLAHLREASEHLDKTLADAELASASLPQVTANVNKASAALPEITDKINKAAADLPEITGKVNKAAGDLPEITGKLKQAADDLPAITGPFRKISPETACNVLDISQQLKKTSDAIGGIAGSVAKTGATLSSLRLQPEATIAALTHGDPSVRSDLNLDIFTCKDMMRLGIANIGGPSGLNLQFGNLIKQDLWFRYGIVQSNFGLGMDYLANDNLTFSGEIFDPGQLKINALLYYRLKPIGKSWWLTTGVYNLFDGDNLGFGITYRP